MPGGALLAQVRPFAIYGVIALAVLAEQWVVPLNLIHGQLIPAR